MTAIKRRATWLAIATTAAFIGVGFTAAGAKEKLDSFEGSCAFEGTVEFSPPATTSQQLLDVVYDGPGTCSGTLNGREVSDAPVRVHAENQADGSCLHAHTIAPGKGAFTFADGTTIRYTYEFDYVGTEGVQTFKGQRSGSGWGHGTFLTQRSEPGGASKCYGEGVSEAPLDLSLTTESPLVSERHGGSRKDPSRSTPGGSKG
jgi:hypothetical protein